MDRKEIKKNNMDINSALSLFDEQFTIQDFSASISDMDQSSQNTLIKVRRAVRKALDKDEQESKYVLDIDKELSDKLHSGEVELVKVNGEPIAQIRDANGKFGKKIPIKEELQEEGVSLDALQLAIQMEAINQQLKTIVDSVMIIEDRIKDVSKGQYNDRVGLYFSGLSLFIEARSIEDHSLKKQIIAQALRSVSDANSQMVQEIRESISYLINEQYRNSKRMTALIKEHLQIVRECYEIIFRASFLKAAIYQECGELASMLTAIDEYGRFIEKLIMPYAGKLSELDESNQFIEKGTWGQIAGTLTGCRELKQLVNDNMIYRFSIGGDNEWSSIKE